MNQQVFCTTLGLDEKDYKYLRQMVCLQHFMTSDSKAYSYQALEALWEYDSKEFKIWRNNMEAAIGKTFADDEEYKKYYKKIYESYEGKGDFAHMLYTISANLNDDKYKVDNKWNNIGAKEMSWKNKEERQDIVGWLGDAVYKGTENKVSFGQDDYIADLDADNIAHRVKSKGGGTLLESMDAYYQDISKGTPDTKRTQEFLKNNPYEDVEKAIFDRIEFKDANNDGKKNLEDLKQDESYKETYDFLNKLKQGQ